MREEGRKDGRDGTRRDGLFRFVFLFSFVSFVGAFVSSRLFWFSFLAPLHLSSVFRPLSLSLICSSALRINLTIFLSLP